MKWILYVLFVSSDIGGIHGYGVNKFDTQAECARAAKTASATLSFKSTGVICAQEGMLREVKANVFADECESKMSPYGPLSEAGWGSGINHGEKTPPRPEKPHCRRFK